MKRFRYFTEDASPGKHFFYIQKAGALPEQPDDAVVWALRDDGVWAWLPSPSLIEWFGQNGYSRDTVMIVPMETSVIICISDPDIAFAFRLRYC